MRTSKDPVNAASSDTIEPDSQRRKLLAAAAGFAAAALAPGAGAASAPPAVTPGSNSLRRFARIFGGRDGDQVQSTHTFYARRKDLEGDGFVPTQWIFNISTRTLPAWLSFSDGRERRLIVRGLGTKSRVRDIVNPDTLDWVRKYYPGFL